VLQIFAAIIIAVGGLSYYNHTGNIRMENASHLAGRAQNTFINGNLDEANVKFERVLADYPNTPGAVQSLVYLLNAAISNNDIAEVKRLLNENDVAIDDHRVLAAFYKLQGDVARNEADFASAIKYFQKAQNIGSENQSQVDCQLNIASTFLAQNNYENAVQTLQKIIDNSDVGFNEKNIAEELLAYAKQKMRI
jgi:tetratricopeptide (TPR) repeat protein